MAHFNLDNYETVAERITKFWEMCPTGRIQTILLNKDTASKQFIVQAFVYTDIADSHPVASGLAEEHFADRGPNETSPLENCETSAIGRALVNWIMSSTADARPSREEREKVNRGGDIQQGVPEHVREAARQPASEYADKPKSNSPKKDVAGDTRWETIIQGHEADRGDKFLADLVEKGKKWGNLTDKQLGAGFNAARKALDKAPRGGEAKSVNEITNAFPGATLDDAPF